MIWESFVIFRKSGQVMIRMLCVVPVHIKQDSMVHNLAAKLVKLDGETEEYYVYGDTLMYNGVRLKQAFAGTGYNNEVRYFQDFDSRIYFMC